MSAEAIGLIERLRGNQCPDNHGCGVMPSCACGDMSDAADEIERLRAEVERLRGALIDCEDYFAERADAEYFPDRAAPVPNEEMRLGVLVGDALRGIDP